MDFRPLGGAFVPGFESVARLPNRNPSDSAQYGLNFKFYLPNFNNGTEFGLYFLNYHSRLPVISAITGTQAGLGNAFGAVNAVGAAAQALAAGLPYAAAIATGASVGQQQAAKNGGNLSAAIAQQYATVGANTLRAGGDVTAQATNIATNEYGKTACYFAEFPENIKMLGASFNTQIQKTGTALQGEVTYRHNVPLQYDDVELLYASLTPFESGVANCGGTPLPATCLPGAGATLTRCNQLGAYGVNQEVRGWSLKDTWQAQFTATQTFANVLKASQLVLLFESAVDFIPGLDDKYTGGPAGRGLRYDGPGTDVSGNAALTGFQFGDLEPGDRFPTRASWGLRRRRPPRVSEPLRRVERAAQLLVAAGRDRHVPGSWRQLRAGSAWPDARHRRQPAVEVGRGCIVDAVWRRRPIQLAERSRLRPGQYQILVLKPLGVRARHATGRGLK